MLYSRSVCVYEEQPDLAGVIHRQPCLAQSLTQSQDSLKNPNVHTNCAFLKICDRQVMDKEIKTF